MNFNEHSNLKGAHAFLSASKYHWDRYDEDKLVESFRTSMAAARGTKLHEFAAQAISLKQKLARTKQTLNMYVNDAIGYRMTPEQVLVYSINAFGTVDAISFHKNLLRIHDLKTGVSPVSMRQLEIYAALFCLEYSERPGEIDMELRIYQNDAVEVYIPETERIAELMSKIVTFDQVIERLKQEEG